MNNSQGSVIMLELNEFNRQLLSDAASILSLKNLQRLVALPECSTYTEDSYDSNFLEPWVQWVSIHTGTPSQIHKIKHLGDVPHLETPQIWETLARSGISCGVWGAMNASRNGEQNCLFFLPDPWTFSEPGFPSELNHLLDLPRYLARNYLNISKPKALLKFMGFLSVCLFTKTFITFLTELPTLVKNLIKFRGEHFVIITFTDYILTDLFLQYRRRFSPRFSILFVNSIAHLQHHHWHGTDYRSNERLALGLRYMDRLVGKVFASLDKNDVLLCLNGLSQENTNQDKPWVLYRQFDQDKFLRTAGVSFTRVEPHMTHDAHIFFDTPEACQQAKQALESANINGQRFFLVEDYPEDNKKLFYRIEFTDEAPPSSTLSISGKTFRFFDLFEAVVTRTGKHIPTGSIFSNAPDLPPSMPNHGVYRYLLDFFGLADMSKNAASP